MRANKVLHSSSPLAPPVFKYKQYTLIRTKSGFDIFRENVYIQSASSTIDARRMIDSWGIGNA